LIEFVLVGWCEIDEDAIASHNALFPEYAEEAKLLPGKSEYQGYHYLDITQIEWSKVPDFDLLIYSSCCQSITKAGKQEGTTEGSGTPSSLIWEIREAIRYKRPRVCILENVADLLTNKFDAQFELWRNTVSEFGYRNTWSSMCAADYGVPQNRNRVFLVSVRNDINKSVYFPEPIGCKVSAEDLLENAVDEKYYFSEEDALSFLLDIHDKQPEHNVKIRIEDKGFCCKQIITPSCIRKKNKKNKQATQYDLHICPTLVADVNYAMGNYKKFLSSTHYPRPGVLEVWHTDEQVPIHYGALVNRASANTKRKFKIINSCKEEIFSLVGNLAVGDYLRLRRLTPRECFRFMSVDEECIDKLVSSGVSEAQLYKQAGNAIVIQVLVSLYKRIFEDISKWWY
jgi:DNA (cytosine-5)-methyltransferase 1